MLFCKRVCLSRFFQPSTVARPPRSYQAPLANKPGVVTTGVLEKPAEKPPARPYGPRSMNVAAREFQPNSLQQLGFFLLCVYVISNLANDWSMRLVGQRAF